MPFVLHIYSFNIRIFYSYFLRISTIKHLILTTQKSIFQTKYPQFVFLTNHLCKNAQNRSINHPRKKRFVQFLQCFIEIIKYLHIFVILTKKRTKRKYAILTVFKKHVKNHPQKTLKKIKVKSPKNCSKIAVKPKNVAKYPKL